MVQTRVFAQNRTANCHANASSHRLRSARALTNVYLKINYDEKLFDALA